jgi:hypothetical protein
MSPLLSPFPFVYRFCFDSFFDRHTQSDGYTYSPNHVERFVACLQKSFSGVCVRTWTRAAEVGLPSLSFIFFTSPFFLSVDTSVGAREPTSFVTACIILGINANAYTRHSYLFFHVVRNVIVNAQQVGPHTYLTRLYGACTSVAEIPVLL